MNDGKNLFTSDERTSEQNEIDMKFSHCSFPSCIINSSIQNGYFFALCGCDTSALISIQISRSHRACDTIGFFFFFLVRSTWFDKKTKEEEEEEKDN